jgi:hypothetical protein
VNADQVSQDDVSDCPEGTSVQWGVLTLDGVTPGDSRIVATVQTAATQAGLAAAPVLPLATFSGSTQTTWNSPDLQLVFAAAGLPSNPWVRVSLALSPAATGGATPVVAEWRVSSTCVAAR